MTCRLSPQVKKGLLEMKGLYDLLAIAAGPKKGCLRTIFAIETQELVKDF